MNTKPILFNTSMVQAILEGRKNQTRRVVKLPIIEHARYEGGAYIEDKNKDRYGVSSDDLPSQYKKDDILWVRESWKLSGFSFRDGAISIEYRDQSIHTFEDLPEGTGDWLESKVKNLVEKGILVEDTESTDSINPYWSDRKELPWYPSIFMPKWAARIFLKVTDVRVERLQDITWKDCIHEGIPIPDISISPREDLYNGWKDLWQSIHGKEYWNSNPWVWVYSFERIEKPENF